jgi:hypothetical protein
MDRRFCVSGVVTLGVNVFDGSGSGGVILGVNVFDGVFSTTSHLLDAAPIPDMYSYDIATVPSL